LKFTVHLHTVFSQYNHHCKPIPVATQAKAQVCGHSLAGIAGSNPTGKHKCLFLINVVCCADTGLCDGPIPRQRESY